MQHYSLVAAYLQLEKKKIKRERGNGGGGVIGDRETEIGITEKSLFSPVQSDRKVGVWCGFWLER